MATTTKPDPYAPAMHRTMAHQLRRTDPKASAEYLRKAREADEALENQRRDEVRAACLKFAQAGFAGATAAIVAEIDEGRAKGKASLRSLQGDQMRLAIFRFLENPPV